MKAEHRHELQTNELAEWLESTVEKVKPYTRAIVGICVAAAIILGVYAYMNAVERRGQVAASDQFLTALSTSEIPELQSTIDNYRGTQPAQLAQLLVAEQQLKNGANLLFANKPVARESLAKAAGDFAVVEESTHDPMLRAWALYGLGRTHESMSDLDRARTDYQTLVKDYPDSALVELARGHLAKLNQPAVKEFYDWFAKQDPRPPVADKDPGVPGMKPNFDLSDPNGDINLPDALNSKSSGNAGPDIRPTDSPTTNVPSGTSPASSKSTSPAATTPAAKAPVGPATGGKSEPGAKSPKS